MLILVISNFFVSVGLFGAVKTFFREKIDFQITKEINDFAIMIVTKKRMISKFLLLLLLLWCLDTATTHPLHRQQVHLHSRVS